MRLHKCKKKKKRSRNIRLRLQISCKMNLSQNDRIIHKNDRTKHKVLVCLVFVTSLLTFVNGCTISNISHASEFSNSIYLHWDLTQDCSGSAFFSILSYSNETKTKILNLRVILQNSKLKIQRYWIWSQLLWQTLSKYINFSNQLDPDFVIFNWTWFSKHKWACNKYHLKHLNIVTILLDHGNIALVYSKN